MGGLLIFLNFRVEKNCDFHRFLLGWHCAKLTLIIPILVWGCSQCWVLSNECSYLAVRGEPFELDAHENSKASSFLRFLSFSVGWRGVKLSLTGSLLVRGCSQCWVLSNECKHQAVRGDPSELDAHEYCWVSSFLKFLRFSSYSVGWHGAKLTLIIPILVWGCSQYGVLSNECSH